MPLPNSQPCRVDVHSVGKWPETQDSNTPEEGTSANMTVIMIIVAANNILHEPVKGMTWTWKDKASALNPHACPKYSFSNVLTTQMQTFFFCVGAWAPWTLTVRLHCSLSALLGIMELTLPCLLVLLLTSCLKSEQWWLIIAPHEGSDAVQIAYFFHGNSCTWGTTKQSSMTLRFLSYLHLKCFNPDWWVPHYYLFKNQKYILYIWHRLIGQ